MANSKSLADLSVLVSCHKDKLGLLGVPGIPLVLGGLLGVYLGGSAGSHSVRGGRFSAREPLPGIPFIFKMILRALRRYVQSGFIG